MLARHRAAIAPAQLRLLLLAIARRGRPACGYGSSPSRGATAGGQAVAPSSREMLRAVSRRSFSTLSSGGHSVDGSTMASGGD